jgi:hypothetical protein
MNLHEIFVVAIVENYSKEQTNSIHGVPMMNFQT